jgi:hypothetical protein
MIDDENWFRIFEVANRYSQIQIVLNILGQLFAHTLATVIINKYVSFMSIGFLVAELLMSDDENWFRAFEESSQLVHPNSNRT